MKTLYLHIGTHKTATTTLQRTLASSRRTLVGSGIYYPDYDVIKAGSHYCHHDIAKSIAGGPNVRFSDEQLRRFFTALEKGTPNDGICFISTEVFYRINIKADKKRRDFITKVKNYLSLSGMQCKVVITLREQASFIDSLYREHVKQTRYTESFDRFLEEFAPWINYRHQVEMWAKAFGAPTVVFYEELSREKLPEDFLEKATGRRPKFSHSNQSNPSLNYDWTSVKRIMNLTALSSPRASVSGKVIQNLQNKTAEGASPNHPRAHFISATQASQLYQAHQKDNAYIAKTFCGRSSSAPFILLRTITPSQPLANPRFLRRALSKILSVETSESAPPTAAAPAPTAPLPAPPTSTASDDLKAFCQDNNLSHAVVSGQSRAQGLGVEKGARERYFIIPSARPSRPLVVQSLYISETKRFSNSLIQLINTICLARRKNIKNIVLHKAWYLPPAIRLHDGLQIINLPTDESPGENLPKPALAGFFFRTDALAPLYPEIIKYTPFITELAPHVLLRPSGPQIPENELVIHLRAGDIFSGNGANPHYGQPPLAFYQIIIDSSAWKKIHLVYEDLSNPVIAEIKKYCDERGIPTEVASGSLHADIEYLLRAESIVVGRGTFMPGVISLARSVKRIYCFNKMYWHWGRTADLYQVNDVKGEYTEALLKKNWHNLPEQRAMMTAYPREYLGPKPVRWQGNTKRKRANIVGGARTKPVATESKEK